MVSQILLLSQPRSACHLLERMLVSQQPNIKQLSHPFVPARPAQVQSLKDPISKDVLPDVRSALANAWDEGLKSWEKAVEDAGTTNQILFTHTHPNFITAPDVAYKYVTNEEITPELHHDWAVRASEMTTNITVLPDEFFLHQNTIPVFSIRHPGLMVPSIYRAMSGREFDDSRGNSNIKFSTNLGWSRLLYDWYLSKGVEPIVADSDDYMTRQGFMRELCIATGLSPDHVTYSWPKASEDELSQMPQLVAGIKKTLLGSDGVITGMDARNIRLEDEVRKWKDEFGEETAVFLKELVNRAMPHYEYLHERRLRMEGET